MTIPQSALCVCVCVWVHVHLYSLALHYKLQLLCTEKTYSFINTATLLQAAYFGEASLALDHFAKLGLSSSEQYNPADYLCK